MASMVSYPPLSPLGVASASDLSSLSFADAPASAGPGVARARGGDSLASLAASPAPVAPSATSGADSGGDGAGLGSFGSIIAGLLGTIEKLLAGLGGGFSLPGATATAASARTSFADVTASSLGDPHESLSGTATDGTAVGKKWDSMTSHADLLDSDSFAGTYRESTVATAPNARGVAYNASATVALGDGTTSVTLDGDGTYRVASNGGSLDLQTGRAVALGNGATVEKNADGSLTIADAGTGGASIVTTLAKNGDGGVDVTNVGHDVDLGGYLVTHEDAPTAVSGPVASPAPEAPSVPISPIVAPISLA